MSFRLSAALSGSLRETMAREVAAGERAVSGALREVVAGAKADFRNQTLAGGLGARLSRAWRGEVYPKTGDSLSAAGVVYTRAPKIMRAFSENTLIRSANGFFLAIPTEQAPKRGTGGKRISPSTFPEARFGPLRFVYRRTGPSLLVVDGVRIGKSGRVGRRAKGGGLTKSGGYRKGITTVVMFLLVPQARLRKRIDLAGPERRWGGRLPQMIVDAWAREAGDAQRG